MENIQVVGKIIERIEDIISDFFINTPEKKPEVNLDSNLRDQLRVDELAFIELVLWLENEYKFVISDDDIDQFIIVQDVVDLVQAHILP